MRNTDRFASISEQVAGQWVRYRVITCDRCGYPAKLRENTRKALPAEFLTKKFQSWGWDVGQSAICPRCQQGKRPMAPAARRAAFCKINNITPANEPKEAVVMAAEEPRTPTPEERRRVRDALDEHYLEDKGCYRQNFSDKSVAAKLNVPVKWVADLREANGFGPDTNEAASVRAAEVRELEQELAKVQDDLLSRFDELQKRLNKIKVDQSYAA